MKNLFTALVIALSVTIFSCSNNSSEEYNRAPAPGEIQGTATTPATGDESNPFAPAPANVDPAAYDQNAATQPVPATQPMPATQQPATQQAITQTTGPVEHFKCPAGHVGGGADAAGKCSVCGAELEHNAAYHQQPSQTQPTDQSKLQPEITPANTPPQTEPAQNAAGIFHYICPDGHAGGSGTQANCASCGKQLVHNDKYHQ